jgi:protein-serine/threonine kinase
VRKKPYQGPQSEVWTLGVLLYTIIFGENPFHSARDILAFDGRLLYPRYIEPDLKRLMEGMLCIDLKKRFTLEKVLDFYIGDLSFVVCSIDSLAQKSV